MLTSTEPQEEILLPSEKGEIKVLNFCPPAQIRSFDFSPDFARHAQYKSLYTKRESLENIAAYPEVNITLATVREKEIIGFGVLAFPDAGERWGNLGPGLMMEIKAVEVARHWRAFGLARQIVEMMMRHPALEEKIIYMVGYSWTWDLDGTGKTAQQYRQMLIRLFEPHGLVELETNEPNICLKPENLLMARIGKNISEEIRKNFKWLRFGVYPA